MILKGKIISTKKGKNGGLFAQVRTDAGQLIRNVLLIIQSNTSSKPKILDKNDTNLVILLIGMQNNLIYGLPYNAPQEDGLKDGEYIAGNLSAGSHIFFNEKGNIEIRNSTGASVIVEDNKIEVKDSTGAGIDINNSKVDLSNSLESLSGILTQLTTLLQNFISVDNPATPTITVQPSTATLSAITALQTNINKVIG